ncbi:MAG: prolipoprotein diacylglyceryl transferase [Alphaproteobacteria bacterium]|nr:prolipoprotein diacylglyceryl transferase [Alphaproteobacteria bacterium]
MMSFAFPNIDPVLLHMGPLKVHWYGVAYVVGIVLGWKYAAHLIKNYLPSLDVKTFDTFITWIIIGIVVGGRLGHVIFYDLPYYIHHPLEILMTWRGGMSFHGGLLGVMTATVFYCAKHRVPPLQFTDIVCAAAPIGIGFGRVANFINGELYGTITTVPWAVEFPQGGHIPRHPTQLYEAALEGFLLWILLFCLCRWTNLLQKPGRISGLFLLGYGIVRFLVEYVKEPDGIHSVGMILLTTGQLLSIPLVIGGLFLVSRKTD